MNLEDFVTQSLGQIVRGVVEAQEQTAIHGARINPPKSVVDMTGNWVRDTEIPISPTTVKFDVALTVDEATGKKGGAGLMVAAIGVGGQASSETRTQSISRVAFDVNVHLPVHKRGKE